VGYYLLVLVASGLLCGGLILVRRPFFAFALATTGLLDTMLDTQRTAEQKQRELIQRLGRMLIRFVCLLGWLAAIVGLALTPLLAGLRTTNRTLAEMDTGSWRFWAAMLAGSLVLLVPGLWRRHRGGQGDYSDWSRLLHRMILGHPQLGRALYRTEKFWFRGRLADRDRPFVVVTGLARSGTTALTRLLYQTGQFHSLSYDNMPFLMAVNLWRLVYRPRSGGARERAHGDRIGIGYTSIEALEEPFFRNFLNDSYIHEDALLPHNVESAVCDEYDNYRCLVRRRGQSTRYLAKNNNFLLRYPSLRRENRSMQVILLFRCPRDHAASLHRQHATFCDLQRRDRFVLEYMNWLAHH
jgi:hypothetical protein